MAGKRTASRNILGMGGTRPKQGASRALEARSKVPRGRLRTRAPRADKVINAYLFIKVQRRSQRLQKKNVNT